MKIKKILLPLLLALAALLGLPDPVIHAQAVPYSGVSRVSNFWVGPNFGKAGAVEPSTL